MSDRPSSAMSCDVTPMLQCCLKNLFYLGTNPLPSDYYSDAIPLAPPILVRKLMFICLYIKYIISLMNFKIYREMACVTDHHLPCPVTSHQCSNDVKKINFPWDRTHYLQIANPMPYHLHHRFQLENSY